METKVLPKYTLRLFREKLAIIPVSSESLDKLNLWWQEAGEKETWIQRFQTAVDLLPKSTPEKTDAQKALEGCAEKFELINTKITALLERNMGNSFMELWVYPALSLVRARPEIRLLDEIIELIEEFLDQYWTVENDQIIAVAEAIVANPDNETRKVILLEVAQWAFEEVIRLIPIQKMYHLFEDMPEQSTIDDLEIEKRELIDALDGDPWTSEKREKFRRIFNRVYDVMHTFEFETEDRKAFKKVFDSATGHAKQNDSAIDILRNAEIASQAIQNDSTMQEFWEDEQEQIDEASSEDEE